MLFTIENKNDEWLEEIYKNSMSELNCFFQFGWTNNTPAIILVPNREAFDSLRGRKTAQWETGWTNQNNNIFLLDYKNLEKESDHKFSQKYYTSLLKHELTHCFVNVIARNLFKPLWLSEGIAVCLSGQNDLKNKPKKFSNFLSYFDKYKQGLYYESGFAIAFLIEKYGKEKMIELLKKSIRTSSKEDFAKLFYFIYDFELEYKNFEVI